MDDPSISGDGRYVAFRSEADNLVLGDTNGSPDVFVHDRLGLSLTRTGTCPGPMTFTASGATPGGNVAFVRGNPGYFTVPSGCFCAGTVMDLVPALVPPPDSMLARGSSSGVATLSCNVSAAACGGLLMQALDLATCRTTNAMGM